MFPSHQTRRATRRSLEAIGKVAGVRLERQQLSYKHRIGRDLRLQAGQLLRSALGEKARRIAVISSKRVFALYGSEVMHALRGNDFTVLHWLMAGGGTIQNVLRHRWRERCFPGRSGLERTDLWWHWEVVVGISGFHRCGLPAGIQGQMPTIAASHRSIHQLAERRD